MGLIYRIALEDKIEAVAWVGLGLHQLVLDLRVHEALRIGDLLYLFKLRLGHVSSINEGHVFLKDAQNRIVLFLFFKILATMTKGTAALTPLSMTLKLRVLGTPMVIGLYTVQSLLQIFLGKQRLNIVGLLQVQTLMLLPFRLQLALLPNLRWRSVNDLRFLY